MASASRLHDERSGVQPGRLYRRKLSQKLRAQAPRTGTSRASRFLRHQAATGQGAAGLDFNQAAALPRFSALDAPEQDEVAIIAALINFRPQIDAQVDGELLRALMTACSEPLFDLVADDADALAFQHCLTGSAGLPMPLGEDLPVYGWQILSLALGGSVGPHCASSHDDGPGGAAGERARALADYAYALWSEYQHTLRAAGASDV